MQRYKVRYKENSELCWAHVQFNLLFYLVKEHEKGQIYLQDYERHKKDVERGGNYDKV
jgi:hypothetical protein